VQAIAEVPRRDIQIDRLIMNPMFRPRTTSVGQFCARPLNSVGLRKSRDLCGHFDNPCRALKYPALRRTNGASASVAFPDPRKS
jgi:hypothetical protein